MNVTRLEIHRQLKSIRDKIAEIDSAMDNFEGELSEFGGLLARRYLADYKAEELQQKIKAGADHDL